MVRIDDRGKVVAWFGRTPRIVHGIVRGGVLVWRLGCETASDESHRDAGQGKVDAHADGGEWDSLLLRIAEGMACGQEGLSVAKREGVIVAKRARKPSPQPEPRPALTAGDKKFLNKWGPEYAKLPD